MRKKLKSGKRKTEFVAVCFLLSALAPAFAQQLTRVRNTTLAMPSAPPTYGYTSVNAFGSLTFVNPVAIASL